MLQRIINFIKLDVALSLRDSVMVYSLIAPLALAVLVRILVPSVQDVSLRFAVDASVPSAVVARLAEFGEIERFDNEQKLVGRVDENDDVPGVYVQGGEYVLVLEGNEDAGAADGMRALLADATAEAGQIDPEIVVTDLSGAPAPISEYGAVMMVVLALFVGGILVGFNIVDEKESQIVHAMAVSPLRMFEYITARSVLAIVIAFVSGFAATLIILGTDFAAGRLAVAIAVALFVGLPFGFIVGALADNQMSAFALIKLLMAVFVSIPFVSIFVPSGFQWAFFVFPNYWMFESISHVLVGSGTSGAAWWLTLLLTAATGALLIALLIPRLRRGLRLR